MKHLSSRKEVCEWSNRLTFGTYKQKGKQLESQLHVAVNLGFTRFDTAHLYCNEATVGSVVRSLLPLSKSHITTKVNKNDYAHRTLNKLQGSLDKLQKLDRVLLHRPLPVIQYKTLEEHTGINVVKSTISIEELGVSNFTAHDIDILLSVARVKPCVNQIEFHPFVPGLRKRVTYFQSVGVPLQAHTVLARAKFMAFPPLVALARRKSATPAQVLLRFALDNDVDAVIHSSSPEHMSELIEGASAPWRLSPSELAEMFFWSDASSGSPHVFFKSFSPVPPVPGVTPPTTVDEYVTKVARTLLADLDLVDQHNKTADDTFLLNLTDIVFTLPSQSSAAIKGDKVSHLIVNKMFPDHKSPLSMYLRCLKRLRAGSVRKEGLLKVMKDGKSCLMQRKQPSKLILPSDHCYTVSSQIINPEAMPVNVAPKHELVPFFQFLKSDEIPPEDSAGLTFVRGTWFADGRMDMCKQVVGSEHIEDLCEAIIQAPRGRVRHFLLGNNVCCESDSFAGSSALANLMKSDHQEIETWYLAGNAIDGESMGVIAKALQFSETLKALWLKRNPIKSVGASHLSSLLKTSSSLELLDILNTGLLDKGLDALLDPLIEYDGTLSIKHLYLGANGITEVGAAKIARLIRKHPQSLESLYLCMNPIGSEGAKTICEALVNCKEHHNERPALRRLSFSSCNLDDSIFPILLSASLSCGLIFLDLGYYKATKDMGERANKFGKKGAVSLIELITNSKSIRALNVRYAGLDEFVDEIRTAARNHGSITVIDGAPKPVTGGLTKSELRKGILHPPCVVNIDSIYRGKM